MVYTVCTSDLKNLVLSETDTVKSILQNVAVILNTWKGDVPLLREFGLSRDALHRPIHVAMAMLRENIIDSVEKYEPRCSIISISFEHSGDISRIESIVQLEVGDDEEY